ncbi:CPBP family intramembrane glutamic endopeptidase [Tenacibaculum sp. 190524A02b]|uniref:Abortive infection protein n=1 Tax=Tenacibaculum vairaonense TaxID=3137860 RepID=A0ABP1FGT4_9FLAO
MTKQKFWKQLLQFITILITIILLREYCIKELLEKGMNDYQTHTLLSTIANSILIIFSYIFIKKNKLTDLAGLNKAIKPQKVYLLIIPLLYLTLLNLLIMDDLDPNKLLSLELLVFIIYCISIGLAEELSIRGFLQSHLIKYMGNTKKKIIQSVMLASFFFGLLHILKFNKGLYGELSQVVFAMFIGVLFGVLLLIVKRIYPLIIMHALIDFIGGLDTIGLPKKEISSIMSLENAIIISLLVLPCLVYAIILMKKNDLIGLRSKNYIRKG